MGIVEVKSEPAKKGEVKSRQKIKNMMIKGFGKLFTNVRKVNKDDSGEVKGLHNSENK